VRNDSDRNLKEADVHQIVAGTPYEMNGVCVANATEL